MKFFITEKNNEYKINLSSNTEFENEILKIQNEFPSSTLIFESEFEDSYFEKVEELLKEFIKENFKLKDDKWIINKNIDKIINSLVEFEKKKYNDMNVMNNMFEFYLDEI